MLTKLRTAATPRRGLMTTLLALSLTALPALVYSAEVVEEASVKTTPWSGYWWPHRQGWIRGPLGKYDQLTGAKATQWEEEHHPKGQQIPHWFGYCHAWAASSVLEKEPKQSKQARRGQQQALLEVGDQKGLLAVSHAADVANTYGDRFGDNRGSEDRNDLAPDTLWRILNLHIKQQQISLILDIEAGAEVWNFPVYSYRIEKIGTNPDGTVAARLTLWFADDGVMPNFVGLKVRSQTYQFQYRQASGSIVMGSATWTGPSVKDHPDFAWYPYLTKPENPQVQYAAVTEILGQPGVTPNPPTPTAPTNPPSTTPPSTTPPNTTPPNTTPPRPAPNTPPAGVSPQVTLLSPLELAALVANRKSDFAFDVTVDRFDGGKYIDGETYHLRATSEQAGFLYLFHVDPAGHLTMLFPQPGQDNRIAQKTAMVVPGEKSPWRFAFQQPYGLHRIKAIVTEKPLQLTGLVLAQQQQYGQQSAGQQQQQPDQTKPDQAKPSPKPDAKQPPQSQDKPAQAQKPVSDKPTQQQAETAQSKKSSPAQTTTKPAATKPNPGQQAQQQQVAEYQEFRWHPTQRQQLQEWLKEYHQTEQLDVQRLMGVDIREVLGRFAQDEVTVYVGPKRD